MRDYEELVKELREKAERFDYDGWVETAIYLEKIADAIEELLAKDTNVPDKWISVEERLPEKSEIVLVAYDNGVVAQGMLFFGKFRGANFGFDENDEPIIAEVTHWMSLPAPPKEETE